MEVQCLQLQIMAVSRSGCFEDPWKSGLGEG
jgi:hypothetical protein